MGPSVGVGAVVGVGDGVGVTSSVGVGVGLGPSVGVGVGVGLGPSVGVGVADGVTVGASSQVSEVLLAYKRQRMMAPGALVGYTDGVGTPLG